MKLPGVEARERHTHTTNRETWIERKRERKRKNPEESACYTRVSQQTLDPFCCQFKLNQISHASTPGAEIHRSRMGERKRDRMGGVLGERRELKVPLASVKQSEKRKRKVKTVRKKETEGLHRAQENPTLRKGERQRKKYGEIESEEK